jgi:hypothetical protein
MKFPFSVVSVVAFLLFGYDPERELQGLESPVRRGENAGRDLHHALALRMKFRLPSCPGAISPANQRPWPRAKHPRLLSP